MKFLIVFFKKEEGQINSYGVYLIQKKLTFWCKSSKNVIKADKSSHL